MSEFTREPLRLSAQFANHRELTVVAYEEVTLAFVLGLKNVPQAHNFVASVLSDSKNSSGFTSLYFGNLCF